MSEWQPIDSAPKDQRLLLFYPGQLGGWICGHWDDDKYAKNSRPYWRNDRTIYMGVKMCRRHPPTHWMPLPPPPSSEEQP